MSNLYDSRNKHLFISIKHCLFVFVVCLFFNSSISANENEPTETILDKKGRWNFQWGYNRSYYTQSDINFRGPGYEYTLKDVNAKDKPESFKAEVYLNPSKFEIPQYNLKISYFFTDRFFLAFGQDHMKYVVTPGQPVKYSGYIDPGVIAKNQLALSPEAASFSWTCAGNGGLSWWRANHNLNT